MNTLSVPSVTMNGGRLRRVTSTPLRKPAPTPTSTPSRRAGTAGTPFSDASFAITIMDRIAIAPTDRSMPAVRMISVCPTARAATTAVCCTNSESDGGSREAGIDDREGHDVITTRIRAGLMAGWEWSRC